MTKVSEKFDSWPCLTVLCDNLMKKEKKKKNNHDVPWCWCTADKSFRRFPLSSLPIRTNKSVARALACMCARAYVHIPTHAGTSHTSMIFRFVIIVVVLLHNFKIYGAYGRIWTCCPLIHRISYMRFIYAVGTYMD